jgi:hypothetical protein
MEVGKALNFEWKHLQNNPNRDRFWNERKEYMHEIKTQIEVNTTEKTAVPEN